MDMLDVPAAGTPRFVSDLDTLIRARYPLIYLITWEEQRLDAILQDVAQNHGKSLLTWSITRGLAAGREVMASVNLPALASVSGTVSAQLNFSSLQTQTTSTAQEWRVRDVETGRDLSDLLEWAKFSGASWKRNRSPFALSSPGRRATWKPSV